MHFHHRYENESGLITDPLFFQFFSIFFVHLSPFISSPLEPRMARPLSQAQQRELLSRWESRGAEALAPLSAAQQVRLHAKPAPRRSAPEPFSLLSLSLSLTPLSKPGRGAGSRHQDCRGQAQGRTSLHGVHLKVYPPLSITEPKRPLPHTTEALSHIFSKTSRSAAVLPDSNAIFL